MDEKELNYVTKIKLPEQDEDTLTLELKPQVQATVLLADAKDIVPSSKRKSEDELIGPDGIYQVVNRYTNLQTTLNFVAQCFRAIALMANGIKDEEIRKKILNGF